MGGRFGALNPPGRRIPSAFQKMFERYSLKGLNQPTNQPKKKISVGYTPLKWSTSDISE